jgi:hypothetical protein
MLPAGPHSAAHDGDLCRDHEAQASDEEHARTS